MSSSRRFSVDLDRERVVLLILVLVVVAFDAIYLLPEVLVRVPSNNDDAFHFLLIRRAAEALARGENPFDFWTPQLELGFATFVHYQFFPHLFVVFLHTLLLRLVDLFTLFNVVRYLLMVLFPITVLWSMRRFGFSWPVAAFAAVASSLLSTPFLYGFDYDSYTWRGFGTYTQLWAMHLSFISLAATHTVITRGRGHLLALVALALLVLSHLLYAYIVAICVGVLFLVNVRRATWGRQLRDVAIVAAFAVVVSAYMWVPFLQLGAFMNVSPYLQPEKYDGFGAQQVMTYLVTGQLFDADRLPVLTAVLALGIVVAAARRTRLELGVLVLFALWLVLYFGRPTFGTLYDLLPLSKTLLIHRFSGAVHLFGIALIGIGAGSLWEIGMRLAPERVPRRYALAPAALGLVFAVVFVPAVRERAAFYEQGLLWMQQTRDAIAADADATAVLDVLVSEPTARVFAGLRTDYGPRMNFGIPFNSVRFSDLLVYYGISVVGPPYNSSSLSSDMLWDFNYQRAEDYDLFDVRYAVLPSDVAAPSFLVPLKRTARYTLYRPQASAAAEYVTIGERRAVRTQGDLVTQDRQWLLAPDRAARGFIEWDYPSSGVVDAALPPSCDGTARDSRLDVQEIQVIASCVRDGTLLLKVTYDPGWQVTVDGLRADTFMVSPAYLATVVPPGSHTVVARYTGAPLRMPLLGVGLLFLVTSVPVTRRLGRHR